MLSSRTFQVCYVTMHGNHVLLLRPQVGEEFPYQFCICEINDHFDHIAAK